MTWTELHARGSAAHFEKLLGHPDAGAMAFVRCLTPDIVVSLAADTNFSPAGWQVRRVAEVDDAGTRTITADQAVEIRESKRDAVLLLVDTSCAGAGMDGIYSAARDIDEASLFKEALSLAARGVTQRLARSGQYAEHSIKKARGFGQLYSVSPWTEFDFLVRAAANGLHPGELLYLLGLWPVQPSDQSNHGDDLDVSRLFVERLLGNAVAGRTPLQRIEALKLLDPSEQQRTDLERFLRSAATKPLLRSLPELADKPHLWVNALRLESAALVIQSIEMVPWRTSAREARQVVWTDRKR